MISRSAVSALILSASMLRYLLEEEIRGLCTGLPGMLLPDHALLTDIFKKDHR
jgi:hypothetical protein